MQVCSDRPRCGYPLRGGGVCGRPEHGMAGPHHSEETLRRQLDANSRREYGRLPDFAAWQRRQAELR